MFTVSLINNIHKHIFYLDRLYILLIFQPFFKKYIVLFFMISVIQLELCVTPHDNSCVFHCFKLICKLCQFPVCFPHSIQPIVYVKPISEKHGIIIGFSLHPQLHLISGIHCRCLIFHLYIFNDIFYTVTLTFSKIHNFSNKNITLLFLVLFLHTHLNHKFLSF